MIPYLTTVALFISLFITAYKLFLQKETFFKINRGFLLAGLILSFVLPLIRISDKISPVVSVSYQNHIIVKQLSPVVINTLITGNNVNKYPSAIREKSKIKHPLSSFERGCLLTIYYVYWSGLIFFAAVFVVKILILIYHIFKSPCTLEGNYRIVEVPSSKGPCSFAHYIFINSKAYDVQTYKEILLHEQVHARQLHSLDLVIAELALIVVWFNPLAWLYRTEIKNNLEYLTDDEVLGDKGIDKIHYQISLLEVTSGRSLNITPNYNKSLLKKRILMMNMEKSKSAGILKYILLSPILASLLFIFDHSIVSSKPITLQKNLNTLLMESKTGQAIKGSWTASVNGDEIDIHFKNNDKTLSNINFRVNEFSKLPSSKNDNFSLSRDAGRIDFKGKFNGRQGSGEFKFVPDEQLPGLIRELGAEVADRDVFTLCLFNLKNDLLRALKDYRVHSISKDNFLFLALVDIDGHYVDMLKKEGYENLNLQQMIAAKTAGINEQYIKQIKSANVKGLTFEQLLNLKQQHVSGDYISSLRQVNAGGHPLNTDQILARKALNVDPSYLTSMSELGYQDVDDQIVKMAALKITPEYVRNFQKIGFDHIPFETLIMLKMSDITPGFIESFKEMGYGNEPLEDYIALKSMDLDTIFIKELDKLGYHHISLRQASFLKLNHVTPQYITAMNEKGYSYSDVNKYIQLRNLEK